MGLEKRYNSMAFTPEEVKKGKPTELVNFLLSCGDDASFEEIHITTDGYCTIVEWMSNYYDEHIQYFPFVDEDHDIVKIVEYPDNSTSYARDDEEAKEMLDEWLKDHPTYKQNEFGGWYDERDLMFVDGLKKVKPVDFGSMQDIFEENGVPQSELE